MSSFSYVDVDSLEGEGPGGAVRKTRRALGAPALGFNYFARPPTQPGRAHSHEESMQEEVYFIVKGPGTMQVAGEEVELRPGRFIRVDPTAVRLPVAGAEGLEFIAFGAPIDTPYEPPPWG